MLKIKSFHWPILYTLATGLMVFTYYFFIQGEPFENFDPFYIHYYNGLLLGMGESLGNIDNPGIFPALEAMLFQKVSFYLFEGVSYIEFSKLHSEVIIKAICVFNGLIFLVLWYKLIQIILTNYKKGTLYILAIFVGFTPLVHITELSPNPFLIFSVLALSIAFVNNNRKGFGNYVWLIFVLVMGLTSKYTIFFHSFVLLYLVQKERFIVNSLITALALIVTHYIFIGDLFSSGQWIWQFLSHAGPYGGGELNFVNWSVWFKNAGYMVLRNPVLILVEMGLIAFIILRRNSVKHLRFLVLLLLADVLLFFFAAKNMPSSHYLIPIFYTMPLKLICLDMEEVGVLGHKLKLSLVVVFVFLFATMLIKINSIGKQKTLQPWVIDYLENCAHCYDIPRDQASIKLAHEVGQTMVKRK